MADKAIRYEVIAEPFYTVEGTVYRDYDAGTVKVGDIVEILDPEFAEPDEEGDVFGQVERTRLAVDIALEVLKRVES